MTLDGWLGLILMLGIAFAFLAGAVRRSATTLDDDPRDSSDTARSAVSEAQVAPPGRDGAETARDAAREASSRWVDLGSGCVASAETMQEARAVLMRHVGDLQQHRNELLAVVGEFSVVGLRNDGRTLARVKEVEADVQRAMEAVGVVDVVVGLRNWDDVPCRRGWRRACERLFTYGHVRVGDGDECPPLLDCLEALAQVAGDGVRPEVLQAVETTLDDLIEAAGAAGIELAALREAGLLHRGTPQLSGVRQRSNYSRQEYLEVERRCRFLVAAALDAEVRAVQFAREKQDEIATMIGAGSESGTEHESLAVLPEHGPMWFRLNELERIVEIDVQMGQCGTPPVDTAQAALAEAPEWLRIAIVRSNRRPAGNS